MSDKYPGGFVTANAPAGFSVAFDGTGDYLTAAASSNLTLGTGDFTIEAWIYPINWTNSSASVVRGNGVVNSPAFAKVDATAFFGIANEGVAWIISDAALPTVNSWSHVAVTRSGTTVKIFINGVQSGSTATSSVNFTNPIRTIGTNSGSDAFFTGYISNVRVLKGTALYTTTFTPPTQMFPVTNTQLLACQSPTVIDNSTNALAITVNGNAAVSNFTPFAAYQGFNPALGAAAGGVWTLDEAAYYQQNRLWPIYDPYFNLTTLMLHGNGTNGAQNNTFLDSSTNNFTITRNGNTTQGTFTPFSQTGWSTYFLRSNTDYLGLPNGSVATGSNDFSIEAFVYPLDRASSYAVFGGNTDRATAGGSSITVTLTSTNGYIEFTGWFGGSAVNLYSPTLPINTWTHFVICRTGTTIGMFVNGVRVSTVACSGSINAGSSANNPSIGSNGTGSADNFTGYISNFRMIIGSGVYSALNTSYTVPTSPLTVVTNTKVLACQSNRYVDNSANNYTITPGGSPSVQAFSPFVPAYITPTTYSNYFDGTGDYLTAPDNAALDLSGDFTVEAWVYVPNVSGEKAIFHNHTSDNNGIAFVINNASIRVGSGSGGFWNVLLDSSNSITVNSWNHVAATRSGNTYAVWVNGVSGGTATSSVTPTYSGGAQIGRFTAGLPLAFIGVLSNLRVLKGTALYTTNFTPPTAPLTNITNTSLLTCQSSTFIDNSSNAFTITAAGNTLPVTSPTPFPAKVDTTTLNSAYSTSLIGGSYYGDGSGDYLVNNSNSLQIASSTNFTFECWLYRQSTFTGDQGTCFFAIGSESANRIQFTMYGSAIRIEVYAGALDFNGGYVPLNAWTHVAIVRTGGSTMSIYINGVFATSASWSSVVGNTGGFIIGANRSVSNYVNGYISGLRLINGTALYTSNFAPPTLPPTAITNTQLLTNFTNGAIFDNTAKNVLETVGNAQISTAQSKWGSGSMYFDGTGDRVHISPNTSQNVVFGTGDFTIELWVRFIALPAGDLLLVGGDTNAAYLIATSTGAIRFGTYNVNWLIGPGGTMTTGIWYHVAVTRAGTTINLFLNGVPVVASVSSAQNFSAASYVIGGDQVGGTTALNGYINDLRITKGVARYVTNFTPPTSQLQDQ